MHGVHPNIPEAQVLADMAVTCPEKWSRPPSASGKNMDALFLCKGGHQVSTADDYLWQNGKGTWIRGQRIENPNTHGTGCTLSSAIAANLAKGYDLPAAVERAKAYISGALAAMLDLGAGSGPLDHLFDLKGSL